MCDCYKIGGPWIEEDPDCPLHGREARQRDEQIAESAQNLEERVESLEARAEEQAQLINRLIRMVKSMAE